MNAQQLEALVSGMMNPYGDDFSREADRTGAIETIAWKAYVEDIVDELPSDVRSILDEERRRITGKRVSKVISDEKEILLRVEMELKLLTVKPIPKRENERKRKIIIAQRNVKFSKQNLIAMESARLRFQ